MKKLLFTTTCLMVLLSCTGHANPIGLQVTKPSYQWKTEASMDKDGFNHCLVKNMYDNGTVMILAQNKDNVTRLALHFPQNKMQANQQFDLTIQIDKGDVFPVEAVAVSPQILTIGIPEALPDQMRKGEALYLRGPTDEVVFLLTGVSGAVHALRDCVVANKNGKANNQTAQKVPDDLLDTMTESVSDQPVIAKKQKPTDTQVAALDKKSPITPEIQKATSKKIVQTAPVLPAKTTSLLPEKKQLDELNPPSQKITKPVVKPEKNKMVAQAKPEIVTPKPLLPSPHLERAKQATIAPTQLIIGRAGMIANKPLDYAWLYRDILVGFKTHPALQVPAVQLPQFVTSYLKQLKTLCTGEFIAEASSFDRNPGAGGQAWIMAETACSIQQSGTAKETISALLFVSEPSGTTIYLTEASANKGSEAIRVRNTLLKTIIAPTSLAQ